MDSWKTLEFAEELNSWVDGKFRAVLLALAPQGRFDVRFTRFEVTWLCPIQSFLLERKLKDSFLPSRPCVVLF